MPKPDKRRPGRKMGKCHDRLQVLIDSSTRAALEAYTAQSDADSITSAARHILKERLKGEGLLK